MLKTRFVNLPLLLILAVLVVFSGCSATPHSQAKAADPVINTILTTSDTFTTTATTPVGTPPGIPPVDLSNWKITQAEAIATASQYLPANVTSQATIGANMEAAGNLTTGETNYYWDVDFVNISVTQAELGWQSDSQTTLNPGPDGNFDQIVIRIDAVSGEIVSKTADVGIYLGPVPTTNTQIQLEPTDFTAGSSANGHRIPITLVWVVIAVCVILITFIIVLMVRNCRTH
jgi:hypothetical protein